MSGLDPTRGRPLINTPGAPPPPSGVVDGTRGDRATAIPPPKGHGKEIYHYTAPWPVYALDWSKKPLEKGFRLALGSFSEEYNNKVGGDGGIGAGGDGGVVDGTQRVSVFPLLTAAFYLHIHIF